TAPPDSVSHLRAKLLTIHWCLEEFYVGFCRGRILSQPLRGFTRRHRLDQRRSEHHGRSPTSCVKLMALPSGAGDVAAVVPGGAGRP
ncbi:MAG: hypothetical protein ACK58T_09870, partial [Phycisphaerae bacterium]